MLVNYHKIPALPLAEDVSVNVFMYYPDVSVVDIFLGMRIFKTIYLENGRGVFTTH